MTLTATTLTEEQRSIIAKVEKLMRLAGNNPNEAESASATARAMELLAAYNLDLGVVEREGGDGGRRGEEKLLGGFYDYERDLWHRVADLNFCLYWNQHTRVWKTAKAEREYELGIANWLAGLKAEDPARHDRYVKEDGSLTSLGQRAVPWRLDALRRNGKKRVRQHRLVGRQVNVAATRAMMMYLSGAIERLTRERLEARITGNIGYCDKQQLSYQLFSRWATSYREGIAARIGEKLWDRRQAQIKEEAKAAEEARRRAQEAGMKGASTETGVTLFTLRQSERDANFDALYGEGWSAKRAAEAAARAAADAAAEAEYTAWAAAHPEEARKKEAEREKEARKRSARSFRGGSSEKERDWGAYRAGYARGEEIGLDQQAGSTKVAGVL